MGEILGPAIILLVVLVAIGAAFYWAHNSASQRKNLIKAPALLLPDGEPPDVLLANAQHMHTLAQRSVRVLDRLLQQPTAGFSNADRKEARSIVDEFYK